MKQHATKRSAADVTAMWQPSQPAGYQGLKTMDSQVKTSLRHHRQIFSHSCWHYLEIM